MQVRTNKTNNLSFISSLLIKQLYLSLQRTSICKKIQELENFICHMYGKIVSTKCAGRCLEGYKQLNFVLPQKKYCIYT